MTVYRDIVIRATKTAVQTALAVLVAAGTGYIDVAVWKTAVVAAGAAALSAAQNSLSAYWK